MPIQKTDRETIITKALEVIRRQGYHRTSMGNLADACGLLKGSLYHHFPSKEALALAVLERVDSHFRDNIFSWAYRDEIEAETRLTHMMEETETYFLGRDGGCLMGNIALEAIDSVHEFSDVIRDYFAAWIDALAYVYKSKFRTEIAQERALEAVAEIQGAIMMMRVFRAPDPFKRIIQKLIRDFQNT